jgi:hypothetical protein
MPHRVNPLIDNSLRGNEEMLSVDRELDGADSDGCPIRNEPYPYLALRVERSYKPNSWAENPPARSHAPHRGQRRGIGRRGRPDIGHQ